MSEENNSNQSRLLRSPLDIGLVVSIVGLLLTITVNVVTMYERVTRIETQMEAVRQSIVQTEETANIVNENQGHLRVLDYRMDKIEQRLDRNGITD